MSGMAVVVCQTIDPRIPTMSGRSMSGFHRPAGIACTGRGGTKARFSRFTKCQKKTREPVSFSRSIIRLRGNDGNSIELSLRLAALFTNKSCTTYRAQRDILEMCMCSSQETVLQIGDQPDSRKSPWFCTAVLLIDSNTQGGEEWWGGAATLALTLNLTQPMWVDQC